jgi:hypothetical protein
MSFDFEALGISKDDLRERIIERAVAALVQGDDDIMDGISTVVLEQTQLAISAQVEQIGKEVVEPRVAEIIEAMTFQKTNNWGEPKQPPQTWRELLVERAEGWLAEPVNYEGKTKAQDSYNWRQSTTRIAYLVEKHLQFEIERVMKEALKDANSKIAGGILGAVRASLNEVLSKLKVEAKV